MDAVLETLYETFDKTKLCVLLYDQREKALRFAPATLKYYEILNPDFFQRDTFPLDRETIACRVARQALKAREMKCENVGNVAEDPDYANLNPSTKSECCVGLLNSKSELLGVLALEREWLNGFGEDDLDLIKIAARHISIAIERAQQSEELEFNSAVAAQTSWAANIAHELNSEVGKIANWAYLIQAATEEHSIVWEYARSIEESAYQLSSANPWSAQPVKTVDIEDFLVHHLQKIAPKKSIEVDLHLGAANAQVEIKPAQFQFFIKQLLSNAARAMTGMEIKKVLVATRLLGNDVVEILFQDFGPGISDDNRASVFHRSFTTKETGGYGLLFVRQVIEDMQGRISLLPYQFGQGAAFLIHFPTAASL
ncbi:MAG: GAF domain-containing sensor histidine kinase [Chloroflexi bacterium]|nr:GAF domain-containing sensor histidine kinase [Chloroflexota bacterium]